MNNNHLVLVSGKSSSGKSASLLDMDKPEGVMYLNCENHICHLYQLEIKYAHHIKLLLH